MTRTKENTSPQAYSNISVRAFVTVAALLLTLLIVCGSLSYFVPQGAFERDAMDNIIPGTYQKGTVEGLAIWRVITAPARVFGSEDGVTIIMIMDTIISDIMICMI